MKEERVSCWLVTYTVCDLFLSNCFIIASNLWYILLFHIHSYYNMGWVVAAVLVTRVERGYGIQGSIIPLYELENITVSKARDLIVLNELFEYYLQY